MEIQKDKSWVSIVIKAFLAMFFMLVLLFALLHTPFLQERITRYILASVISRSEGKMSVGKAEFNIYKGVSLQDIILTDHNQDTLMTIGSLGLNPRNTLLSFITGDLEVNDLSIDHVNIKIQRSPGAKQTNWEKFLASFANQDPQAEKSKAPVFDFSQITLSDVSLIYDDPDRQTFMDAYFERWELEMDSWDFSDTLTFSVSRWVLNEPVVQLTRNRSQSISTDPSKSSANTQEVPVLLSMKLFDVVNGSLTLIEEDEQMVRQNTYTDLDIGLRDMVFRNINDWSLGVDDVSGNTDAGRIRHLEMKKVIRTAQDLTAISVLLRTDRSLLRFGAHIKDLESFSDWTTYRADLTIAPSYARMSDLFDILPFLRKEFEREGIAGEAIQVTGRFMMDSQSIQGKGIDLWVNSKHHFVGNATVSNLNSDRQMLLDLQVKQLDTDITDLSRLYSKIPVSDEMARLGKVRFNGDFKGFISDFKARGFLSSTIGDAGIDVTVREMSADTDSIQYAGTMQLDSFDLGRLLENADFGRVTASLDISNGRGIDFTNSDAELVASIESFEFKDFIYSDAVYSGRLSRKKIDGTFNIADKSLDFKFSGIVDFSGEEPIYDFVMNAQDIDFCSLNLTDFPCHLSFNSDVNFKGKNLRFVEGLSLSDQIVLRHDTSELKISNLSIASVKTENGMRFTLLSDFIDFNIEGEFHLMKMYQVFLRQLIQNHPGHNTVVNLKDDFGDIPDQNFVFDVKFKEANALFDFLHIDLAMEQEAHLSGFYDKDAGTFNFQMNAPLLTYNEIVGDSIRMMINSADRDGEFVFEVKDVRRNNAHLSNVRIQSDILRNRFDWSANYTYNQGNHFSLTAQSLVENGGYYTRIIDHDLLIDSAEWNILPNRGFGIYKNEIDIENFEITDGRRYIAIKDISRKGLEVSLNDFNFEVINPLINYDKLYFTGTADSKFRVEDIFEKRAVQGYLDVPDFAINGDDYGSLLLRANQAGDDVIDLDLRIVKDQQELYTRGYINPAEEYVNVDLTINQYPMNFFEYIIEDGISDTEGTTDIEAKIYGHFDDMKLSGLATVNEAGVGIDYLGTYYRMENEQIKIDENFIDLTGVQLIDARENRAVITGGLRHKFLGDFRTDLTITSPEFIALSTTDLDNPFYYGIGNGDLVVRFDGPFDAVNMRVTATTGPYTQLFIPITSTQYGYDESFVNFDYDKGSVDSLNIDDLVKRFQASGVDFEMNLTFTSDAEVSVIYDESTSNVLEGRGRGNLSIKVKRDGEFSVYGTYDIEEGEYRYTAYGFIAKPFIINRGGRVSWTGDPINATLEVTAGYAGLRAPLNVFLQEYIESSTLQAREFSQRREVDLTLLLTGTLFDPQINFDIGFPNLTGELKTLADAKVRALESTENGINNQVVGLLVFRNFLPDNNPFASLDGSTLGQSGNNTITEFLTSQLSLLFSEYLSAKLKDNGLIEGIDLEIAVAQNTSVLNANGQDIFAGFVDFVPDEVQLNLRNRFKNDNLVLSIGGNYVRQSEFETAQDYLTGDFALDWFISEDKRLKLRFYGNYDYDEAFAQRKQIYGFGINYRREFGSISTYQQSLDNLIEEVNKVISQPTTSN